MAINTQVNDMILDSNNAAADYTMRARGYLLYTC